MLVQVSFHGDDVAQGGGSEQERASLRLSVEAVVNILEVEQQKTWEFEADTTLRQHQGRTRSLGRMSAFGNWELCPSEAWRSFYTSCHSRRTF